MSVSASPSFAFSTSSALLSAMHTAQSDWTGSSTTGQATGTACPRKSRNWSNTCSKRTAQIGSCPAPPGIAGIANWGMGCRRQNL